MPKHISPCPCGASFLSGTRVQKSPVSCHWRLSSLKIPALTRQKTDIQESSVSSYTSPLCQLLTQNDLMAAQGELPRDFILIDHILWPVISSFRAVFYMLHTHREMYWECQQKCLFLSLWCWSKTTQRTSRIELAANNDSLWVCSGLADLPHISTRKAVSCMSIGINLTASVHTYTLTSH